MKPRICFTAAQLHGHKDNASAEVYKSIRAYLFNPVVDRIESELKRRFSTDALSILSSLACVLCPSIKHLETGFVTAISRLFLRLLF